MIKNNFAIFLFFLAIVNGIVWGIPFDTLGDNSIPTAELILEGGLFSDHYFISIMIDRIFYSIFMAGVFKVFGFHLMLIRIIQVLIFAGLAVIVYRLGKLVFNERLARLAGFITAICYTLASFTSWIYREILFTALVFLFVYFLYKAQLEKKNIWFIMAGVLFGLATLTNAVIQFFVFIIIANFLFLNRKRIRQIIPKLIMFFVAFVLVMSPFIISNYINFDRTPFPFGARSGLIMYMRLEKMDAIEGKYIQHLIANTTGDYIAQKLFSDYDRSEARLGYKNREEWEKMVFEEGRDIKEVDNELNRKSIIEMIKRPISSLKLASLDFLKFNTPMVPDVRMQHMFAEPGSHSSIPNWAKIAIILGIRLVYFIFFIFIISAIVKNIRNWPRIGWIVLIVLYFNLFFSAIHAIARYSLPMYPFYIILLAIGLLIFWDKLVGRKQNE